MIIYRIWNKTNNKSYIGSSETSFKERYRHGKWWKWTHSLHLKSAVNKYGLENFDKDILWEGDCSKEELIEKEKEYILLHNSMIPNGYNLIFGGKSAKAPTHIKSYELIDKNGNEIDVKNLSLFCRERKLNYGAMLNMVSGINNSSQGFALKGTDPSKITVLEEILELENILTKEVVKLYRNSQEFNFFLEKEGITRRSVLCLMSGERVSKTGWKKLGASLSLDDYCGPKYKTTLYHEDGRELHVDNIYKFCKENGLNRAGFYPLVRGKGFVCSGWSLCKDKKILAANRSKRRGKELKLISPKQERVEVKNITAFCKSNDFVLGRFYFWLRKGAKNNFHGWKLDNGVNIDENENPSNR